MARLRIATITDADALAALAPEWEALFEAAPEASPFQSPAWLLAWAQTFAPEALCVFAAFEGESLAGLAPFFIHRGQLTLLGNGASDHLDLLARPDLRAEVVEALAACLAETAAWDCLDFRDVPAGSPLLTMPLLGARERIEPEEPCPLVDLPLGPDAVVGRLDKKRRYDLRHGAAQLAGMGEIAFEFAQDEASRSAIFQALVDLHQQRWAERGECGVFSDPLVRAFHEDAMGALLAAGLLRLFALKLDGRIIAAHYALKRRTRAYSYLHAFAPKLAACHPGALLTAHVLQEAVREGATSFDFLRGAEAYKYRWGAADQAKFRRRVWR